MDQAAVAGVMAADERMFAAPGTGGRGETQKPPGFPSATCAVALWLRSGLLRRRRSNVAVPASPLVAHPPVRRQSVGATIPDGIQRVTTGEEVQASVAALSVEASPIIGT